MSFPMRINYFDRFTVDDRAYRAVSFTDETVSFESVDGGKSALILKFEKLKEMLKLPNVTFEREYYLAERLQVREKINVDAIGDLPDGLRSQVLWRLAYCQALLQLEETGDVKRTDASITHAMPRLNDIVSQQEKVNQFKWKALRAGQQMQCRKPPCPKTLRTWVKKYEASACAPIALIPHCHRSGNRNSRFCLESRRLMGEAFEAFLTMQRKTKKIVFNLCRDRFKRENAERKEMGLVELPIPSRRTVERALAKLDPYFTKVHRYGADQANRETVIWEDGIDASYPLERVEIDEWKVDLITILAERGALDGLTREELANIKRGRRWLYVAIDCATRCVVGMRLAENPNAVDAISTLADITRDKTDIAIAAGCSSDWNQHGGLGSIVTDQGAAFVDDAFRTSILDAGGAVETPPASTPKLRGRVERVFRTFGTALMPHLVGRTFSNPKERGDYPAEDMAAISDDALMQMLVIYVVDVYHNLPHRGLNGETPRNCWKRLASEKGVTPDPSERTKKRAFGTLLRRRVSGKGVTVYNIDYTCAALRHFHLHSHETDIDLKIDPGDLGWIMIRIGQKWYAAMAIQKCFDGVCLEDWRAAAREINLKHRNEATIPEAVVAEALRNIEEINAKEQDRFGKYLRRLTPQALLRAEDDNFLGLSIDANTPDGFDLPPEEDLFGSIVPLLEPDQVRQSAELEDEDESEDDDEGQALTWRFEDD